MREGELLPPLQNGVTWVLMDNWLARVRARRSGGRD
jgi:hypothetical protein